MDKPPIDKIYYMHNTRYYLSTPKRQNQRSFNNNEIQLLQQEGVIESSIKSTWCVDVIVEDGITGYDKETEGGSVLILDCVLLQMGEQFLKRPMYIEHINVAPDDSNRKIVGYIIKTYISDGKLGCEFIIIDDEAHNLLCLGWQTSSSWTPIKSIKKDDWENGERPSLEGLPEDAIRAVLDGFVYNGNNFEELPLDIKAEHLAVVERGRHNLQHITRVNSAKSMADNTKAESNDGEKLSIAGFKQIANFFSRKNSDDDRKHDNDDDDDDRKHDNDDDKKKNDDEEEEEKMSKRKKSKKKSDRHHDRKSKKHDDKKKNDDEEEEERHNDDEGEFVTHKELAEIIDHHIEKYHSEYHSKKKHDNDDDDDDRKHDNDDDDDDRKHDNDDDKKKNDDEEEEEKMSKRKKRHNSMMNKESIFASGQKQAMQFAKKEEKEFKQRQNSSSCLFESSTPSYDIFRD